jgi:NAD(P)-dependent dehydrogenase (short-subunit alcohol dehydrogenase family)
MSFLGRAALMTGAASGIGRTVSEKMLQGGLSSLIAYDFSPAMMDVAEEMRLEFPNCQIIPVVADVTDPVALQKAFATPLDQPLTIVGNNAGIGGLDWEKVGGML